MKKVLLISTFLVATISLICLSSCKKKSISPYDQIIAIPWNIKFAGWDINKDNILQASEVMNDPICHFDDQVTFLGNGTHSFQDLGVVCGPPTNDTYGWQLYDNDTKMRMFFNGQLADSVALLKLTADTLITINMYPSPTTEETITIFTR
jgi:hypothetical protein